MKLWNRIKYRLLVMLLDDVCEKSHCKTCECGWHRCDGSCGKIEARIQARKVYMPEEAKKE